MIREQFPSKAKLFNSRLTAMFVLFRQMIYVWRSLILAKMEVPVQQTVTGRFLHAIVFPDILVIIADMHKVIHIVKKQPNYGISLLEYIFKSYIILYFILRSLTKK